MRKGSGQTRWRRHGPWDFIDRLLCVCVSCRDNRGDPLDHLNTHTHRGHVRVFFNGCLVIVTHTHSFIVCFASSGFFFFSKTRRIKFFPSYCAVLYATLKGQKKWRKVERKKMWKTNDHNPIGYNDGLGVIKAGIVVVYVRVIHWCCHARTPAPIPSSCLFLFFFFLVATTIFFVTNTRAYLLSLSPCRSMTRCTEIWKTTHPNRKISLHSLPLNLSLLSWFIVNDFDPQ